MRSVSHSADEHLLAQLLAPPDLSDGVQSLGYWRERRRNLPWYRMRARREAARMTVRWERRVGEALASGHGAPIATRLSAGLLVARTRLQRWSRRAAVALMATVGVALLATPAAAVVVLLLHAI